MHSQRGICILRERLGNPRAKAQYDALLHQSWLTTPKAVDALARKLKPLRASYGCVDAWVFSGKDIASLHHKFQFKFIAVESSLGQKFEQVLSRGIRNNGVPDDLTASLGAFDIYVAVAKATF